MRRHKLISELKKSRHSETQLIEKKTVSAARLRMVQIITGRERIPELRLHLVQTETPSERLHTQPHETGHFDVKS